MLRTAHKIFMLRKLYFQYGACYHWMREDATVRKKVFQIIWNQMYIM